MADIPLGFGKSSDLLLWVLTDRAWSSAVSRWGPSALVVSQMGWPLPGALACPQASCTGGPIKGQHLTVEVVVSDHIDLFPVSFCPVTVSLESVVILFVSFSHHQESAVSVVSSLAACRGSGLSVQPCCRHHGSRGQWVHFTYLAAWWSVADLLRHSLPG